MDLIFTASSIAALYLFAVLLYGSFADFLGAWGRWLRRIFSLDVLPAPVYLTLPAGENLTVGIALVS